tara:strand:+ start:1357 stop:2613 length:1257 start_codon:yes stop_codon:yes gene_type:complete
MGKGGSTSTSSTEIPYWLEDAARRNLNQADRISRIGAVPMSYGPTVAAFSPMQNSSFLNTANQASAFGLDAPIGTAVTGGMPAPTNYGGVSGYSAKPVFDAITGEFRADRPAQASYIDSFFINPFTGTTGINAGNVSDIGYENTVPVGVDGQPVISGGAGSGGSGGSDPYNGGDSVSDFLDPNGRFGLAEHMERQEMNYAKAAQDAGDNILNYGQDDRGGVHAIGYGGNTISPAKADEIGLTIKNTNPFDMSFGDHVSQIGSDVVDIASNVPTPMNLATKALSSDEDLPGNAFSRAFNIGAGKKDESSDSGYAGEAGDGCVIATHALSTGVYNYQTRREAEVWCMRRLHDKWWGETIRRGYRYLGRRKIDQGKASEHYDEFKRYIAFATGKRRDLRGALTFTLRSVQFFAVGLFTRNS